MAIVLFSGHGCLAADGLYYLTHEADFDDLKHTSVSWEDVARRLKTIQARQVLFFSDCCHLRRIRRPDRHTGPVGRDAREGRRRDGVRIESRQ